MALYEHGPIMATMSGFRIFAPERPDNAEEHPEAMYVQKPHAVFRAGRPEPARFPALKSPQLDITRAVRHGMDTEDRHRRYSRGIGPGPVYKRSKWGMARLARVIHWGSTIRAAIQLGRVLCAT